jgi:DNA-binding IclR family transcriptional regulator
MRYLEKDGLLFHMLDISSNDPKAGGSQTVGRAIELLRLVSSSARSGIRLGEVVAASGLSRPTAHRLLKELVDSNLLMRAEGKRYFLGHFAYELGLSAAAHFHLRDMCASYLERVAKETGDTVFMVVRSGSDSFCLDRKTGAYQVKVFSLEVGNRQPLGVGAGGLALLSWLPESERDVLIAKMAPQLAAYGGLTTQRLRGLVAQARKLGHSLIADYAIEGVTGIGLPVLDRVGQPIVAVSVTAISPRMTPAHQAEVLRVLQREVARLQDMLNQTAPALRK